MKHFTRLFVIGGAAALSFGLAMPVCADVITFQNGVNGYTGTDDNHLYSSANSFYNAGSANSMTVGFDSNGKNERRMILRFDVSSLAGLQGAINSAQLTLTGTGLGDDTNPDFTLSLYQIAAANAGWIEGNKGFNPATAGESTWRAKHDGDYDPLPNTNIAWAGSAGLSTAGTDYLTPLLDWAVYTGADAPGALFHFEIDASVIQHWITDTNAGLLLISNTSDAPGYAGFYSSDNANTAYHPQLEVTYTPVPEPATGLLLMGGAMAMLTRRRKSAA